MSPHRSKIVSNAAASPSGTSEEKLTRAFAAEDRRSEASILLRSKQSETSTAVNAYRPMS